MPTFKVVPVAEARRIRETVTPEWKARLRAGDMLLMDKRPGWHGLGPGYVLRSKSAGEGKGDYVWLEEREPLNVAPVVPHGLLEEAQASVALDHDPEEGTQSMPPDEDDLYAAAGRVFSEAS